MHVDAHAVPAGGDAEDAEPRGVALLFTARSEHGVGFSYDVVDVELLEAEVVLGGVEGRGGLALPVLPLRVVRDVHLCVYGTDRREAECLVRGEDFACVGCV